MKQNPLDIVKVYRPKKVQSLNDIFNDLKHISEIKKCSFCGCNSNTLKEFAELAQANGEDQLAENANKLQARIDAQKRYDCLGCRPCYAADISNTLFELNGNRNTASETEHFVSASCSGHNATSQRKWPAEPGNYFLGNDKAAIAINTLSNNQLPKQLIETVKDKIAIVGYCETENIGIEKVVKNIISNPNIRTLIICGNESGKDMLGGHFSGQALLSLHSKGINEKNRIIGAQGKRPVVKNLSPEQIERFQSQVEIIDIIGNNSIRDIIQYVEIAYSKKKPATDNKIIGGPANREIIAKNPQRLVLDKKGYFVILPDKAGKKIVVEHYANSGELLHTIVGHDAASIYYTIIEKEFVSKPDHCAYLGKELTKAEYYINYDIPYIQDKALGEIGDE